MVFVLGVRFVWVFGADSIFVLGVSVGSVFVLSLRTVLWSGGVRVLGMQLGPQLCGFLLAFAVVFNEAIHQGDFAWRMNPIEFD